MQELKIFNNSEFGNIRTVEINGKIYFVGIDIAKALGYSNPSKAVIQHCKGVTKLGIPSNGGNQETNCVPEGDLYRLVTHSELPSADRFESWVFDEVLPDIRKTGSYNMNGTRIESAAYMVKFVADDLRVNEASRLLMYENMCKDFEIPTGFLPKYEHNGSRQLKSLSALLEENHCGISAVKFNKLLLDNGYLEERERSSTKGNGTKRFKALTGRGLAYGENAVSPHNQREVQPLYYSDTFMELFGRMSM